MYRLIKLINIHAKVYLDLFIHLKVIYLKLLTKNIIILLYKVIIKAKFNYLFHFFLRLVSEYIYNKNL